ncbi:signal transduction histidine kinase [Paraburkholderia sp. BL18I3N2]|uniref:sensor histidine kinase n=1 Tax=Paraburkholderia sp. BL18I3N2 TaxID=1938799 RepID=UPI000D059900|nr:sensor histidine kinase [Paraburkholderia sp. BL18I3N2]PRX21155.1 signal transduction histidine kinase [Paraburkholderia sp. BL18I3N2]
MRLSHFILDEMEAILVEWETFAATLLPAAQGMSSLELRDHARPILEAIARDLSTPQTRQAQLDKSRGLAPVLENAPETAAQTHAVLRARRGFDINQLCAEYRALRAVVLRLWQDKGGAQPLELDDVIRFNEAIDQALTESVSYFSSQVDRSRNLLLGMLGHDMRSPLQTIQMTAHHLAKLNDGEDISVAVARLIRSGARMQALLDDMVDFSRTKLGLGIRVVPAPVDVAALVGDELDQLRVAHGTQRVELDVKGDTGAVCDGRRIQQMVGNLVGNAIRYGEPAAAVKVAVIGEDREISIVVTNCGPAIPPSVLRRVFEPLERGPDAETRAGSHDGLGLGLYIAREIARAHGGEVDAHSNESETVFTVRLPRRAPDVGEGRPRER